MMRRIAFIASVLSVVSVRMVSAVPAVGTNLNDVRSAVKDDSVVAVSVDPSVEIGPIKPMNATNNGPVRKGDGSRRSSWREFAALKVPFVRTHDAAFFSGYGGEHMGDVSAIFPDFDADADDPASYDFVLTDAYVRNFAAVGTKAFFRLGQKIEHASRKYHVYPPKDFGKWARVAEHIIRHYTDGWAGGFDAGIEYWEIWNEPDLDADGKWKTNPRTWGGSQESFYEFYATVATHLKKRFPQLKIGGPGFASSPDTADDWGGKFLRAMKGGNVPIDFFSWHRYVTDPEAAVHCARTWRRILDTCGYPEAESILDEWNYVEGWDDVFFQRSVDAIRGVRGAALVAATMAGCQKSSVDMLMYYDLRPGCSFNGVFDSDTLAPLPGYWSFYAWRKLRDAGTEIAAEVSGAAKGIFAVAAKGREGKGVLLVASYQADPNVCRSRKVSVSVKGRPFSSGAVKLVDSRFQYGETEFRVNDGTLELYLEPCAFAVIEF